MPSADVLLFKTPAEPYNWESRIPLGNGRLGIMLKGDPFQEGLQLNEEHIWSGGPMDRNNSSALKDISKIREKINQGEIPEAQELAFRSMSGSPVNMRVYQNAGDFNIDFFTKKNFGVPGPMQSHSGDSYNNYSMSLDMKTGTATVKYTDSEGTTFTRTTFVSAIDDCIIMHIQADKPGKINFRGNLERGVWLDAVWTDGNFIYLDDAHGVPFTTGAGAVCKGGKINITGTCICAEDADEAVVFISIYAFEKNPKDLKDYEKQIRKNVWTKKVCNKLSEIKKIVLSENGFSFLHNRHNSEFSSFYDRITFSLNEKQIKEKTDTEVFSTPELIQKLKDNNASPEEKSLCINQYANFGRYLLISSSRNPGKLPSTLQGIWNCHMDPPWGSKYTININLQMNYWPACMCGLSETENTVFELLSRGYKRGLITAKKMYGCRGYVMHHNTDIWGDSAPQDAWVPGTYWTLGSGWLATHIWENYEYTLNKNMLSKYYYLIHEACLFYCDYLVPSKNNAPDGKPYLILNPSASPENTYKTKDGVVSVFCPGCEMDNQILTHLFESCIKATRILGNKTLNSRGKKYPDSDLQEFEYVLKHIKKTSLNSDGSIMEWNEEVEEVEPGHRHISHLYGLFPGHSISPDYTPLLAEGAKKTLSKRLSGGGGHTGWSQAWIINFRAALRQGNEAGDAVEKILSHSTHPNLLDVHPPFQIDGNFGALAGILRMIIQSDFELTDSNEPYVKVHILPALPENEIWKNGKISGIKIRGNLCVDLVWENWKVKDFKIYGSDTRWEKV